MRVILGSLCVLAACGDTGGGTPGLTDAPFSSSDASTSSDAQSAGLTVTWETQPSIPGSFGSGVTVSSVTFKVARLEVIGDTGSTVETTQSNFDVVWSAAMAPFPINFPFAQPGLYSKVSLQIDGDVTAPSYEILGTVVIGGSTEPFRISDTAVLQVDVDGYSIALMAGRSMNVPIQVKLQDVIDGVDFAMLPTPGGVRTMNQNTTGIADVRSDLKTSTFKHDN